MCVDRERLILSETINSNHKGVVRQDVYDWGAIGCWTRVDLSAREKRGNTHA